MGPAVTMNKDTLLSIQFLFGLKGSSKQGLCASTPVPWYKRSTSSDEILKNRNGASVEIQRKLAHRTSFLITFCFTRCLASLGSSSPLTLT